MSAPIKDTRTVGNPHKQPIHLQKQLFDCFNSEIEMYKCRHCNLQTHFLANLSQHTKKGHAKQIPEGGVYTCLQCSFQTYSKYMYVRHKKFDKCASKSENDWLSDLLYQMRKFPCEICEYRAIYKSYLNNHIRAKHTPSKEIQWLICQLCKYKTKWTGSFKRHMLVKHTPEDQIVWFKCKRCDYKSKLKTLLKRHVVRMHQDFNYSLSISENLADDVGTKKEVDDIQFFGNQICNTGSVATVETNKLDEHPRSNYTLVQHTQKHQTPQLHCEEGDYKSNLQHMINNHVTISSRSWLVCRSCSFKCRSMKNFKTHVLRHHTQRFNCHQCTYKSKTKHNLKEHVKASHGWSVCPHCAFRTRNKSYLDLHILSQHTTDEIPSFKCQYCSFQSRWREALKVHITEKHPSEKQDQFECRNYNVKTKRN